MTHNAPFVAAWSIYNNQLIFIVRLKRVDLNLIRIFFWCGQVSNVTIKRSFDCKQYNIYSWMHFIFNRMLHEQENMVNAQEAEQLDLDVSLAYNMKIRSLLPDTDQHFFSQPLHRLLNRSKRVKETWLKQVTMAKERAVRKHHQRTGLIHMQQRMRQWLNLARLGSISGVCILGYASRVRFMSCYVMSLEILCLFCSFYSDICSSRWR
jgi:hypothetical protein